MWTKIKKYLSSVNLTIFLLACLVGAWKGVDPCSRVVGNFLDMVGISDVINDVEYSSHEGPPLLVEMEIELRDGRIITVLANGAINIK